jgi:hypothetical protein
MKEEHLFAVDECVASGDIVHQDSLLGLESPRFRFMSVRGS